MAQSFSEETCHLRPYLKSFVDLSQTDDSRNSGTKSATNYLILILFLADILIGFSRRFLKYKDLPRE